MCDIDLSVGAAVNNGTIVEYCIDVSDRKRAERVARESDQALRASEERLRRLNEELEDRVHARTAEINALFKRLVTAQEEERRRIARDIHDQLGQQMTALRMNLESLRSRATGDAGFIDQMARTARLAEELDKSVDFLTWDLRPAALDHLGLSSALHNLVSGWSERFHIAAGFDASGDDRLRLPRDVEANLYRIAQEALHNVVEHAGATHVSVLLQHSDDETVLVIEDNGRGFGGSSGGAQMDDGRLGLVSMRERATIAGGRFEIESRPSGTAIFIRVPHIVESL